MGLVLWLLLTRLVPPMLRRTIARTKDESEEEIQKRINTLMAVFMGAGKIIIATGVIFMVLSELDIPIGPVLAGFGVVGLAVGFGAQYLIRDLIAGIFILMENQYRVGDVVSVAGTTGLVEQINLRKTVLRDLDGILHHIPNGEIKVASNFTRLWARAHFHISVAYKEDLDRVLELLRKIWEEVAQDPDWKEDIISKTPSFLRVEEFGDSGIIIKIAGETKPIRQWDVMGELRRRIKKVFDEEGIEIPWPHTKVYFGDSQPDSKFTCPTCAHVNLPGSNYCAKCGASLTPG